MLGPRDLRAGLALSESLWWIAVASARLGTALHPVRPAAHQNDDGYEADLGPDFSKGRSGQWPGSARPTCPSGWRQHGCAEPVDAAPDRVALHVRLCAEPWWAPASRAAALPVADLVSRLRDRRGDPTETKAGAVAELFAAVTLWRGVRLIESVIRFA